jgi:hypothetical protein
MRILIISPHFPPTNAADMQRARLILPYLKDHGVKAEIISIEPEQVAAPQDPWLELGLPKEIQIHRLKALSLRWAKLPGLGTLGFRAIRALARAGDELLGKNNRTKDEQSIDPSPSSFDLVYFSTTVFGVHVLGPRWKKKFGVPFIMDYQDPWVSDYYREHPDVVPPGGRLKYAVASWLNRRQEPRVLRHCSGITSVSAAYPEQLKKRYSWLELTRQEVGDKDQQSTIKNHQSLPSSAHSLPYLILPFPGDARDFERVKSENIQQSVFDPNDRLKHWVYVGVCPPSMTLAVRALFSALANLRPLTSGLRIHFIGTSYAAAGQGVKIIEPLAKEFGLGDIVHESTDRIPYSETLRCLLDADALIIPGSDDPSYTASKIYPYLLAEKPLLAVFHEQSSVVELISNVGGGKVIPFASRESPDSIAARIESEWLVCGGMDRVVPLDHAAFARYSARSQAKYLLDFWEACLNT